MIAGMLKIARNAFFGCAGLFFKKFNKLPENPENILIIRSGAIGDVLMTTPLLAGIRRKWPQAKICYLVGDWSKAVLANNPDVDEILDFDDRIIVRRDTAAVWRLASSLKAQGFELCFILDKSWLWNLFAFRAGCRFRAGFDRDGEGFCNNLNLIFRAHKHEMEYYADLGKACGVEVSGQPALYYAPADEIRMAEVIKDISGSKLIGIAPGGAKNPGQSLPAKRWPRESYAGLCIALARDEANAIVFFGSNDDRQLCDALTDAVTSDFPYEARLDVRRRIFNLCGKLSIQQSYLLMQHCDWFVTHDSGAMHIAAAAGLGKKLVVLFGQTSPRRFAPKDATVLPPIKLPVGYDPEQDVYTQIAPSEIEYASVHDVLQKLQML